MEYFAYTRLRNIDYKLMFSPSDTLCPSDIRQEFIKEARGIINVERYPSCLDNPTWFFSKKNGIALFGVGINNMELSDLAYTDFTGRGIRGFFGIIAPSHEMQALPMDLNFFKDFYQQYVLPIWECNQQAQAKQKGIRVTTDLSAYYCIQPTSSEGLNTHKDRSVVHGNEAPLIQLLAMALSCPADVNVVGEIAELDHAFDANYRYMNCKVAGTYTRQEHKFNSGAAIYNPWQEPVPEPPVKPGERREETPKKAYRPKMRAWIMFLCVLAVLLVVARNCSRKTTSDVKQTTSKNLVEKPRLSSRPTASLKTTRQMGATPSTPNRPRNWSRN